MKNRLLTSVAAVSLAFASVGALAAPIFWTDWSTSSTTAGFIGNGTITTTTSTVNVTYTNRQGIAFFQNGSAGETDFWTNGQFSSTRNNATSAYTSGLVDNAPTGTDIIALQFRGSQTLHFSQAIANPVFSYVSLNGNGYSFDQDFDILSFGDNINHDIGFWGIGTSSKNVIDHGGGNIEYQLLGTGEPHGTLRFKGAFQDVTWTSLSNENWNGFTVGVQGTAVEVFETPEPGSLALLGLGLVGLALARKRKSS